MASKLFQLNYPLAAAIWSALEHFRMSGNAPTGQLLGSFTEGIRAASPMVKIIQSIMFFFLASLLALPQ